MEREREGSAVRCSAVRCVWYVFVWCLPLCSSIFKLIFGVVMMIITSGSLLIATCYNPARGHTVYYRDDLLKWNRNHNYAADMSVCCAASVIRGAVFAATSERTPVELLRSWEKTRVY